MSVLLYVAARIIIGWILIDKVPVWLNLDGIIEKIVKVIGVLMIISALLNLL